MMPIHAKKRKPSWLKTCPPKTDTFGEIKNTIRSLGLYTVCQSAHCPNIAECWDAGTATFMILGNVCTRACRFCAVPTGLKGAPVDPTEPQKLCQAVKQFGLTYVVLTSVDRDDLPDQGAQHYADCIARLKQECPHTIVEILAGDFQGKRDLIAMVVDAQPEVFGHNIETVRALSDEVRDYRAHYDQSLGVLATVKEINPGIFTKSSLMLGLGETQEQVEEAMDDLRNVGCDFLTIGQYLQPGKKNISLKEYVAPETFKQFQETALKKGFLYCASGPFVRSSYRAGDFFIQSMVKNRRGKNAT